MAERDGVPIGLACAGGGIEGSIYEIGALCALDEAIDGLAMHRLDVYVGVSAGALVASCLANGISAHTLGQAILSQADEPGLNIQPEVLFAPALREYAKRLAKLPGAVVGSVWEYLRNPFDLSPLGALAGLGSVVPVGLFDNEPIEQYLAHVFDAEGRTNTFDALKPTLRVVAVNVDTAEIATFGDEATAHIPISKAVQASTALPGLYVPVEIDGAFYVDGVVRRTVHASVALDQGAQLLFCINPLVPVQAGTGQEKAHPLVPRGLPPVLSQSFRTLVYSRMRTGFRSYHHLYPNADTILFEPTPEDYQQIFTNLFSFSNRHAVCEYAYQTTRHSLRQRTDEIAPILERYGLHLRRDVLNDPSRTLYANTPSKPIVHQLHHTLDRLDAVLQRIEV